MTPLEIVRQTSPIVNQAGNRFYFDADTMARGKELGLDGFRFYFLGRGGVLGDVDPAVIVAAFGYFSPGVVELMWDSAKQVMAPRDAAREYLACADRFGDRQARRHRRPRRVQRRRGDRRRSVDRSALSLFAGIAAEPLPDHPAARAYRNICILRELRGSIHLLAIVATGVSPLVAHTIRRPDDVTSFGWESAPDISDDDRSRLDVADELTDRLLVPSIEALTEAQRDAFVTGIEVIGAHLDC